MKKKKIGEMIKSLFPFFRSFPSNYWDKFVKRKVRTGADDTTEASHILSHMSPVMFYPAASLDNVPGSNRRRQSKKKLQHLYELPITANRLSSHL